VGEEMQAKQDGEHGGAQGGKGQDVAATHALACQALAQASKGCWKRCAAWQRRVKRRVKRCVNGRCLAHARPIYQG
jgi:hypothetical protein